MWQDFNLHSYDFQKQRTCMRTHISKNTPKWYMTLQCTISWPLWSMVVPLWTDLSALEVRSIGAFPGTLQWIQMKFQLLIIVLVCNDRNLYFGEFYLNSCWEYVNRLHLWKYRIHLNLFGILCNGFVEHGLNCVVATLFELSESSPIEWLGGL